MKCASVQRICQNLAARFAKPQSFRGLAQQKLVSLVVGGVQEAEWEGEDFLRARNQPQGGSAVRRPRPGRQCPAGGRRKRGGDLAGGAVGGQGAYRTLLQA